MWYNGGMKIDKVLIANRGEIAVRILRTARDLGIKSVAVYSDQDIMAPFAKLADESYTLDGTSFSTTYMNTEKILEIAKKTGVDALHPGYGFLSENAEFASEVEAAGIKWIGPSADAIDMLGDKVKARIVADKAGVSPVPGISRALENIKQVRDFVAEYQFPIILKRLDGGGGHGIFVIRTETQLENFEAAHTADISYYFVEKFAENARHVETQCARDSHGNFVVVSTRDCSIQRRNQKLLEEAPAPFLPPGIHEKLLKWSQSLFETVGYVGLGTCEFLLECNNLYFLEVNPRLQVEHTVSEEVSGLDLVEQQIRIAEGKSLSVLESGSEKVPVHSIEFRITSENPHANMTPTSGILTDLRWPAGPGVRLETGVELGDVVTTDFDSMIAKIIITGKDRISTIARAKRALRELEVVGISTPKELFELVLDDDDFIATSCEFKVHTKWLESKILPELETVEQEDVQNAQEKEADVYKEFVIEVDKKRTVIKLPSTLFNNQPQQTATAPRVSPSFSRRSLGASSGAIGGQNSAGDPLKVVSPMQGIVVSIAVEVGQKVQKGDLVVVLEAMKMEKFVVAETSGIVEKINVKPSDPVNAGVELIELKVFENAEEGVK
ncbi:MAG: carboxylate--amine ligase [Candidatus Ancillula sp.]|jgi:acetyl-CoA/propionyl-CoA carboxylase biotin carboxyl carrier protein|nr:carboxylate--amine ligase [Candidatus Ancillula sp.]